ncbi:MAG: class I SAM-dependent methyltransferase [Polaribacter sp.]|uniref:class I SAM-dependent methyltransferase n=1 Tax=Polaribacter sp. TaxID=1920175 RepID=UPI002F3549C2
MKIKKIIKKFFFKQRKASTKVGTLNEKTRVDWIESTLKKIPENSRILDAGAGEQQFKQFCKHLKYVSQDFAAYNPSKLKSGLQVDKWDYGELDIISDIANIPQEDSSFDAIMCTEVFEHIINPREALKEFKRLLKKNGYLIITAPFCSLTHFAPYHYYTGFSKYFYELELEKNDFTIIDVKANGNYFEYLAQEVKRIEHVSKNYTQVNLSKDDKANIYNLEVLLEKLSKNDTNSSELLCFGYHILARKK